MPSSILGIGSTFYGKRDFREDGSHITTEWLIVVGIPLIPLRSFRVSPLGGHRIWSSNRDEQGPQNTVPVGLGFLLIHWTDVEVAYEVHEKHLRPNWKQVICTYAYFVLMPAWGWFTISRFPLIVPRAFNSMSGVLFLLVSWLIPASLPWVLRYYARKTMPTPSGHGSAAGLPELDKAIRAQLDTPGSKTEFGPPPAQERLVVTYQGSAQEHQAGLDEAKADRAYAMQLAATYNSRGYDKKQDGDLDGAIADYTRAIELKPDADKAALVYYNRGAAKEENGDVDGAIEDYTQAIELNPADADARNNRGYAREGQGDLDGAIADFTRVIELKPDESSIYEARSHVKRAKGDLDGAAADHAKAIELIHRSRGQ
jgi:tetratricopeptide (TPR) repeat protein